MSDCPPTCQFCYPTPEPPEQGQLSRAITAVFIIAVSAGLYATVCWFIYNILKIFV